MKSSASELGLKHVKKILKSGSSKVKNPLPSYYHYHYHYHYHYYYRYHYIIIVAVIIINFFHIRSSEVKKIRVMNQLLSL